MTRNVYLAGAARTAIGTFCGVFEQTPAPILGSVVVKAALQRSGVPADRVAILEKAFQQAARSDKFRQFVEVRGFKVEASSAAEFRKLLDSEVRLWKGVLKEVRVQLD